MMNNNRNFEDLVILYRSTKFNDAKNGGVIHVSSEDLCDCITDIINYPEDFGVTLESGNIAQGQEITVHFSAPKLRLGQFHRNFDSFLKNGKNRLKEPKYYYIFEDNYFNKDTETPEKINKYRILLRILALFKESSAYLDEPNNELVFVESTVVKIPVIFDSTTLKKLNAEKAIDFIALFSQDTHRDQKLTILANTIRSMGVTKNKESSFDYLIGDFTQLSDSFNKGYNIYVSGFSYDKILDQLRAAKIEEMGKIHKVFSDIQNQIIGIPLATIIVATQMKQADGWNSQALVNSIVILGALFFTAMVFFAVFNQWQTLRAIAEELKFKESQVKTKFSSIYSDIQITFSTLKSRIIVQHIVFIFLWVFIAVGIILAVKFYFLLTPHAYYYIFGK